MVQGVFLRFLEMYSLIISCKTLMVIEILNVFNTFGEILHVKIYSQPCLATRYFVISALLFSILFSEELHSGRYFSQYEIHSLSKPPSLQSRLETKAETFLQ